jgi:trk system potassium uptake protein TrkH
MFFAGGIAFSLFVKPAARRKSRNILALISNFSFNEKGSGSGGHAAHSPAFLAVFFVWAAAGLLGALPYYFSGCIPRFTDAVFESVSGFTTTGLTVLRGIETVPPLLLFWRALTQWLGGAGILLFITTRPTRVILLVYAGLTVTEAFVLRCFGMNWFDAVTHAFSTISTGGFSTHNNAAAHYNSAAVEWVLTVFMFLAGFNYFLLWQMLRGKLRGSLRNSEAKAYAALVVFSSVIIAVVILSSGVSPSGSSLAGSPLAGSLRNAFFNAASILSTTGFSCTDLNAWPALAQGLLFFLMFTGGCSLSTAGGIKIVRYVVLAKQAGNEMKKMIHHSGVYTILIDGKNGKKDTLYGTAGFVYLYCLFVFLCALLVSSAGATIFTSLNTALACLGNIGAGLGELGPFNQFPRFPGYVKWGLSLAMITGRLELWAVLVLFTRGFRKG